jgi:hypothetical protein
VGEVDNVAGWTQGLVVARQVPYHLSDTPSPFCFLVIFQVGSLIYAQAGLNWDLPIFTFIIAGITVGNHHILLIDWRWGLANCLGWPHTVILLISAFWVARIIGVRHHAQP